MPRGYIFTLENGDLKPLIKWPFCVACGSDVHTIETTLTWSIMLATMGLEMSGADNMLFDEYKHNQPIRQNSTYWLDPIKDISKIPGIRGPDIFVINAMQLQYSRSMSDPQITANLIAQQACSLYAAYGLYSACVIERVQDHDGCALLRITTTGASNV